jgi:hypothetical protein
LGATGLAAVALAWLIVPRVASGLDWFPVRRVELVGVRHLAPDAVIEALRLGPGASVFADLDLLTDRVRGLAGVANARVSRHLPGALRVAVREVEPVAFVPGPRGLVVVDGVGRVLPFDPARSAPDLPVAEADTGVAVVLALVRSVDPSTYGEIEFARATPGGDVVLEWASRRVVLERTAAPEDVRAVVLVAQDLAARARRSAELDARYEGQIVARRRAGG